MGRISSAEADRFNQGKLQWSLVDFNAFEDMVRVLEFGAQKYDAHNWKKGLMVSGVCESLIRHLFAYMNGEDIDPESGLPHIGHIQCNAMFLGNYSKRPELDDRYKPEEDEPKQLKETNYEPITII